MRVNDLAKVTLNSAVAGIETTISSNNNVLYTHEPLAKRVGQDKSSYYEEIGLIWHEARIIRVEQNCLSFY